MTNASDIFASPAALTPPQDRTWNGFPLYGPKSVPSSILHGRARLAGIMTNGRTSHERSSTFSGSEGTWAGKVGLARDAVRQALVRRQLAVHLPESGPVLDVGCGQGTQLIALARAGFAVTGVDPSEELLNTARAALEAESSDVQNRVRLIKGELPHLPPEIGTGFDVVCCHGVVMYLSSLQPAINELARLAAPSGVVSVLSRNRAGIALRAGMTGDWQGAIDGITASTYANRIGVANAQAHDPTQIHGAFAAAGLHVEAWYGVRLLTDHWGDVPPPPDVEEVITAEAALGAIDPYRQVAALTHTIGRR